MEASNGSYTDAGATASDAEDGPLTPTITSNTVVPNVPGAYAVTWSATDSLNSTGTATRTVNVIDTTPPTISLPFSRRAVSTTTIADYTAQAVTSDIVGVTNVTQSPAPGSALVLGATVVTLTAHDAAGNTADATFTLRRYPPEPGHTAVKGSSDAVPGAGSLGGAPVGAVFTSFGVPAINDAEEMAFAAKWSSPLGAGAGIFLGNPVALVAQVGGDVPGLGGMAFKAFADPVLDAAGHVAFRATLTGTGVNKSNDTVLVTNAFGGTLQVVAREGGGVNEPGTPLIKAIGDVSLVDGEMLFTATLAGGSPAVNRTNDAAAFRIVGGGAGPQHVVREGVALGTSTVKAFKLLTVVAGSPGQNRAHVAGMASFLVLLADGTQALATSAGGILASLVETGDTTGGTTLPAATFKSFGLVAAEGDRMAFAAVLNAGVGGVATADARGIFLGDALAFEPVARVTGPAAGIAGATFKTLSDPVLAPGAAVVAFPATLKGAGIGASSDGALFYRPEGGALRAIAREGGLPPGTPAGTKWKSFVSLAIPGGDTGPIFHATLARGNGVKAGNDAGVWAVDSAGTLRLLFREGDVIGGRTLKAFTVLNAVPGSVGVTRAFNHLAQVAWLATFTDGSSSIMVTTVP